jgi:hypothetical protein
VGYGQPPLQPLRRVRKSQREWVSALPAGGVSFSRSLLWIAWYPFPPSRGMLVGRPSLGNRRLRGCGLGVHVHEVREAITSALDRDPDEYIAVRGSASPPTLTEWVRQKAPSLIQNFGMSLFPQLIADDKTAERIFRMPWWTYDVRHANTDLLLSDRPCLLEGNAVDGECLIVLPLSPMMLFFICNRKPQIQ